MPAFLQQIFTLLTVPPGNLIYHIVLAFSIAGALQGAVYHLRLSGFPQARRAVFGLGLLLGLQMLLFLAGGLAWQNVIEPGVLLPALDRLVSMLALVWIAWLWAFPEPVRLADAASVLLSLFGLTLFGLTYVFFSQGAPGSFNLSIFDLLWQGFSLAVILLGLLALVLRRPNGWGNGLAMLLIAMLGHLVTLIFPQEGAYPGLLRLAHLALFPILLTLPQRFLDAPQPERRKPVAAKAEAESKNEEASHQERRRYSTDPKTFQSLIQLAAETAPARIPQYLARGVAQAMLADLCFLLTGGNEKELAVTCGYDLIREEILGTTVIQKSAVPLLANAIARARPLRLPASSTSSDLKGLGEALGLSNAGHLLSVPISSPQRGPLGAILVLSPYSNRLWSAEDQAYLANVSSLLLPVLERSENIAALQMEVQAARENTEAAVNEAGVYKLKVEELGRELDAWRQDPVAAQAQAENLNALLLMQEELRNTVDQLTAENEQLRAAGGAAPAGSEQLELELRQTLQEMAHMQNAVVESNRRIMELEKRPAAPITSEQVEVIASISQELRQPMSSIVGYTDLLLGESVGILGTLQRKFVERVKASIERIGGLIEDLIQITNLDTGSREFRPELIDLNLIIDKSMAYTSTQIREKNITLRLDIPEEAPQVRTDRDALQQVIIHLLQNATAATQAEGTITLRVQTQVEEGIEYLSVQVTDTGGGIAAEDLPRVFARRYRAEHSLIQGVGDTGVGLSIAKSLVEAQNGRIWVETESGEGSRFSVLLPVLPAEGEG